MPKLFISFTGTLQALQSGRVDSHDLESGLFCFDCFRAQALATAAEDENVESIVRERPDLHKLLIAALIKAEAFGRIRWFDDFEDSSFELVNLLLVGNGYNRLTSVKGEKAYCYNYQAVEQRSTQLEVIWQG